MKLSLDMHHTVHPMKPLRYGSRIRPERDWLVALAVCAVLLLTSVVFNTVLFLHVQQGESIGTNTFVENSGAPASVRNVENLFAQRAQEEERYQHSYHFIDPSHSGS